MSILIVPLQYKITFKELVFHKSAYMVHLKYLRKNEYFLLFVSLCLQGLFPLIESESKTSL